jgi:hemerythrin-like domain-containing protein
MKRDAALRDLSSEHHTGLVLVRRIREQTAPAEAAVKARWEEIRERFASELEPHFQKEENGLLPMLRAIGESALVERTLREHEAMRRLVADGGPEDLLRFAQWLDDHIRFEERELFDVAQRRLSADQLSRLAASRAASPRSASCGAPR